MESEGGFDVEDDIRKKKKNDESKKKTSDIFFLCQFCSRAYFRSFQSIIDLVKKNQVTRGHNIVADGWAGAYNLHLNLPHTYSLTQIVKTGGSQTRVFAIFN